MANKSLHVSLAALVATLSAVGFIGCTDTSTPSKAGVDGPKTMPSMAQATSAAPAAAPTPDPTPARVPASPAITKAPATMLVDASGIPMLKNIYAGDFMIGTAMDLRGANDYNAKELQSIRSQYNIVTPENSMKPQSVHPSENQWTFAGADRLVAFCQENNIKVHGHTLAWHSQTPSWFFTGPDGQPVTRDLAIARLKAHIEGEVGHFKGKIWSWDVVNEAINDNGPAQGENLRNSPWVRAIGPDYITMAFKFAHDADPQAELFYNDYNIERGTKHANSLVLLKRLIKDGAPITGVGIQGHWSINGTPFKDVDQAIADYKALGLKVSISELDLTIGGQNGGQLGGAGAGRGGGAATPQQLQQQASAYAQLFGIFEKYAGTVERVTFWGTSDNRSWRQGQSPLLYDGNINPKPAIQAIADVKKAMLN